MDDDPEALRLTVTVRLVVGVTRARVLDRYAAEVLRARADSLDPEGFAPLAYAAACTGGPDEATDGPAGRVGYLADPGAVVAGIPGIAVEDAAMAIERTPAEVVRRLRADRGLLERAEDGRLADDEPRS